jgi:hypothetical protein
VDGNWIKYSSSASVKAPSQLLLSYIVSTSEGQPLTHLMNLGEAGRIRVLAAIKKERVWRRSSRTGRSNKDNNEAQMTTIAAKDYILKIIIIPAGAEST